MTQPAEKAWQNKLAERKKAAQVYDTKHRQWLSQKFGEFEFDANARFESMLQYPKRRSLYRKHVDIGRDYKRKNKFYTNVQRISKKEREHHIQLAQDKFTKLLQQTVTNSVSLTNSLKYSYHSWLIKTGKDVDFDKLFETKAIISKTVCEKQNMAADPDGEDGEEPVLDGDGQIGGADDDEAADDGAVGARNSARLLSSHRSISVDNLPQVVEDFNSRRSLVLGRLIKSLSTMSVQDVGQV